MLAQKPIKVLLIMVLIVGLFPVIGWAGPSLLTDDDMDGIYAKGIWVNFEINIALPGGNTLSVPFSNMSNMASLGNIGGTGGGVENVSVSTPSSTSNPATGQSTPSVVSAPATGQSTPSVLSAPATSQSTPSATSGNTTSSPANTASPVYEYSSPGSGFIVTGNAMQGNSGLMINAPNSAVSMTISVVVLNNSTVGGNIIQSSNSYPTNLFLSLKSYMQ